jgi:CMP-N-acetylneuraminic acid synthetase
MKTVAVILARGNSKGMPGKNLIQLNKRPMLTYTIEAAVMADGIDETWVSTDSKRIAAVAEEWGAKVLMRPDEYSTDEATSESALLHFAENVEFDQMVFIQPTSPLLTSQHIECGLRMMSVGMYHSVFSASMEHWLPRWERDSGVWDQAYPSGWDYDARPRRQDVKPRWIENGAFYITTKKSLLESGRRYSGVIGIYQMPTSESFQVDDYEDLKIVEALMARRHAWTN